jgi:hypothetical protein
MHGKPDTETLLRAAVFPMLALVFLAQAYACRGLFADGASYLLDILQSGHYPWWDIQRIVNHFITKTPAILAIRLGVRDLVVLRYIFSTWLLLCPLLIWGSALWSLRRDILFWPFALLFGFVYFSTCFLAVGEYNVCFALLGFCFAQLVRPLPRGFWRRAGLLAAAALLPLNYPATLFSGMLLALIVLAKPEEEWNGAPRPYRAALLAFFALSVVSALWELAAPRDPNNLAGAGNLDAVLHDAQFFCVFAYAVVAGSVVFVPWRWLRFALAAVCMGLLVRLAGDRVRYYPYLQYAIRAYMSVALAVGMAGLWWFRARGAGGIRPAPDVFLPAALGLILIATLSAFDIGMSRDYARYIGLFSEEVNARTGLVPYEKAGVPFLIADRRFGWGWNTPLMSVVLRDNAGKAVILNPRNYRGYEPFDPRAKLPDLDRYYR